MCTVSILPLDRGYRLMCNRDELITRPVAQAPVRTMVAGVDAIFPVDPPSGGTWLGVNDAGLTVALLTRTSPYVVSGPGRTSSRGEIVPRLLGAPDLSRLLDLTCAIEPTLYDPFRIVGIWRGDVVIATSDGARLDVGMRPLTRPIAFTSSSLDDSVAERLRLPLFDALVAHANDPLVPQRVFHGHQWADCPAFSVRMRRSDARTLSRSTVTVGFAELAVSSETAARALILRDAAAVPRHISFEYETLTPGL